VGKLLSMDFCVRGKELVCLDADHTSLLDFWLNLVGIFLDYNFLV